MIELSFVWGTDYETVARSLTGRQVEVYRRYSRVVGPFGVELLKLLVAQLSTKIDLACGSKDGDIYKRLLKWERRKRCRKRRKTNDWFVDPTDDLADEEDFEVIQAFCNFAKNPTK